MVDATVSKERELEATQVDKYVATCERVITGDTHTAMGDNRKQRTSQIRPVYHNNNDDVTVTWQVKTAENV